MGSSFLKVSRFRASESCERSLSLMPLRRLTFLRKPSYVSDRFDADSLTMWLNVSRSSFQHKLRSGASTLAARRALYSSANSPKTSPGAHTLTTLFSPWISFLHSGAPSSMMYKQSPSSPSLMIVAPASNSTRSVAMRTTSKALSSNDEKRNDFFRIPLSLDFSASDFSCTGGSKAIFLLNAPWASALTDCLWCWPYPLGGNGISSGPSSSDSSNSECSSSSTFLPLAAFPADDTAPASDTKLSTFTSSFLRAEFC
mmetsp:Transcript_8070/g.18889  ORF Transcript_8070/g.18889 Transcript_8070/m.18889 type:complete len:256 (+) Transcript_8070:393-1160(+)